MLHQLCRNDFASPERPPRTGRALAGWFLLSMAAAAIGAAFSPGEWYRTLQKPPWTPPDSLFGPVWSILYGMMSVAAWLVWQQGGWRAQKRPLTLYVAQLALNAAWTPLFFGLRSPSAAFIDILLLWLAISATLRAFWRVSRPAALLLLPYWAWVGFAAALNAALWRLNSI